MLNNKKLIKLIFLVSFYILFNPMGLQVIYSGDLYGIFAIRKVRETSNLRVIIDIIKKSVNYNLEDVGAVLNDVIDKFGYESLPRLLTSSSLRAPLPKFSEQKDLKSLGDILGEIVSRERGELGEGYRIELIDSVPFYIVQAFGEQVKEGEIYFSLWKKDKFTAYAKTRPGEATLVIAQGEQQRPLNREFAASLLGIVSKISEQTGRGINVVLSGEDRFRKFLEARDFESANKSPVIRRDFEIGNIHGTKYFYGEEKFFQLEYSVGESNNPNTIAVFKPSSDPLAGKDENGSFSLLVVPFKKAIINGYGMIGTKLATVARKLGLKVVGVIDVSKHNEGLAKSEGIPFYTPDALGELLDSGVDIVFDCTPPEIGARNRIIYDRYPDLKIVYQSGTSSDVADINFTTSTGDYRALSESKNIRIIYSAATVFSRIFKPIYEEYGDNVEMIIDLVLRRYKDPEEVREVPASEFGYKGDSYVKPDILHTMSSYVPEEEITKLDRIFEAKAALLPMTYYYMNYTFIKAKGITVKKVKELLAKQNRVAVVEFPGGKFDMEKVYDVTHSSSLSSKPTMVVISQVQSLGELKDVVWIITAMQHGSTIAPEETGTAMGALLGFYDRESAIHLVDEVLEISQIKEEVEERLP